MSAGLLPTGLLDKFAVPDARTYGYRVTEEIIRPGVPFHLYAIAADLGGKPLMTPVGNTPAISVDGMGMVLSRGGRTAARMALSFGLGGAGCLVLSGLLLAFHEHLPRPGPSSLPWLAAPLSRAGRRGTRGWRRRTAAS